MTTNNNQGVYKFGWQAYNRATQGGVSRFNDGHLNIAGLMNSYRSRELLSLFAQIALNNQPVATEEEIAQDKHPVLMCVSFEQSIRANLDFLYTYLKAHDSVLSQEHKTDKQRDDYVFDKLGATGFSISFNRFTHELNGINELMNAVLNVENRSGGAVHVLAIDDIDLMSVGNCQNNAQRSAEFMKSMMELRAFCVKRNIVLLSTSQLSCDARLQLLDSGKVKECDFVTEVQGNGWYNVCKSMAQTLDTEIVSHCFVEEGKKYLAVQVGKQRKVDPTPSDYKYFILPFPEGDGPVIVQD